MKRVTIFILLISLLLTGCRQAPQVEVSEEESLTSSVTKEDEQQNPLPSEETASSYQQEYEDPQPEETTESVDIPETTQQQTYHSEEQAESKTEATETVDEQTEVDNPPATEAPPKQEVQETQPTTESPSQTVVEPTESEPVTSSQPVTEPEPKPTEETEPEPEPTEETNPEQTQETEAETEPADQFEIGTWISFAKSYAQSIGLNLDSTAVDCWDNPITAGAHCIYLERDICSRLDRYNRDEDITDVWIWAVEIGNGCYDLYIGYA